MTNDNHNPKSKENMYQEKSQASMIGMNELNNI